MWGAEENGVSSWSSPPEVEWYGNGACVFSIPWPGGTVNRGIPSCHSGERSDVGIRCVYAANLRGMCNACALETDCHTSLRIGSQ